MKNILFALRIVVGFILYTVVRCENLDSSKPLSVPHRTTDDIYLDPCKAKAFLGDIALSEEDYSQYERYVDYTNKSLTRLLRFTNYPQYLLNIALEQLTISQVDIALLKVRSRRKLRRCLLHCMRLFHRRRRRHHAKNWYRRCIERKLSKWHKTLSSIDTNRIRTRRRRAATARPERLWDYGIIPYEIQANFSGGHKAMFKLAMRHWENYTCITFVERDPKIHRNYIIFTDRSCGCCSFVGRRGNGVQAVSIGKNCDKFGIVVHELGHVIGFWHEHTRPDRDNHVDIIYKNIQPGQEYNFNKLTENEVNSLGEEYDFGSIMHYARNTFAKKILLDTIVPKTKSGLIVRPAIGQRIRLSVGDVTQANKLYKCAKCGRTYQNSSAKFGYSPESIHHDRDNRCEWRISATHGEKIILKLTLLDIPESPGCKLDYLEIRDGFYEQSNLMGVYCGPQKLPLILTSSDSRMWLGFKSTRGRGKGFQVEYEAVCGGDIITEIGHLTSPNYPDDYEEKKHCVWRITVPQSYQVALSFQVFDIEKHNTCVYDYLEIRDGHDALSPLLGRFCGQNLPPDVKSTQNKMWIKFVSDSSVEKRGFAATFIKEFDECNTDSHGCDHICVNTLGSFKCRCNIGYELHSDGKKCEDACGGYIDTGNGTLQTPSYPDFYPANKNCEWKIIAPEQYKISLNFTHFDLEGNNQKCDYDSVEIRSGDGKKSVLHDVYCGSTLPPLITSQGNTLRVIFNSDNSVQKTGFNAYFFTDKDECSVNNGGCEHICENTKGSYRCLCHNGYMLHTNQHYCKEGGGCHHNIIDPHGEITSPNWPDPYPPAKHCVWDFTCKPGHKIKITFTDFQLEMQQECTYDHVQFYDGPYTDNHILGRFCGSTIPDPIISSTNKLFMAFLSDASIQRKGFSAVHTTECGGTLKAISVVQTFYSHSRYGDRNYGIQELCDWKIEAGSQHMVKLHFKTMDIEDDPECGYDHVQVFDGDDPASDPLLGQFCGQMLPDEMTSSRESLTVLFKTDDTISAKGFMATYYAVKVNDYDIQDSRSLVNTN